VRNGGDVHYVTTLTDGGPGSLREGIATVPSTGRNVVLDHLSASWSIGESLSVTHSMNVTVQWCVITESLNNSCHEKGAHGYGSLLRYGAGALTFHHNLYADHTSRNPRLGDNLHLDFVNNVIHNWGAAAGYNGDDRPDNPADRNATNALTGYTRLEEYLNWLADAHAACGANGQVDVNLRAATGGATNLTYTVASGSNGSVSLLGNGLTASSGNSHRCLGSGLLRDTAGQQKWPDDASCAVGLPEGIKQSEITKH
jgi:hypothetical protein